MTDGYNWNVILLKCTCGRFYEFIIINLSVFDAFVDLFIYQFKWWSCSEPHVFTFITIILLLWQSLTLSPAMNS